MGQVWATFSATATYRWLKIVVGFLGALLAVVGLAGLRDDLDTWGRWLGGVNSDLVYGLLYGLLLLASTGLLVAELLARRGSSANSPPTTPNVRSGPVSASAGHEVLVENAVGAPQRSSSAGGATSERLQKQLDEGVRLRRNIPAMPGIASLTSAETTEADVDMWVKRTQRLLRGVDPELLAEFNYRPGRAVIETLLPSSFEPRYKKGLDQRIANLRGVIDELRHRGL